MIEPELSKSFGCFRCGNIVCYHNDVVSTHFQGGGCRAFMFYQARNVTFGEERTKQLITGPHVIADVHCSGCQTLLGWKYHRSLADRNRWKEGKVCLLMYKICQPTQDIAKIVQHHVYFSEPIAPLQMEESTNQKLYCCFACRSQVALHDDVVSKNFQRKSGRAFLFSNAKNVVLGLKEDRQMMTGLHTVADVMCCDCGETIGWKYLKACEESQKYKEGKFVLEKSKIAEEHF